MSQGVLCQKIRFLGQKLWPVACGQTDRQTNMRMETEYLSRLSLSSFCLWFERSNIACLDKKSPKKSLARLSSAKTCLPKTRYSTFFGIRFSTMTYWINGHVSYIKQNSFSIATICKRPHVDKMNGAPAGPFYFRIDKKKTCTSSIFIDFQCLRLSKQCFVSSYFPFKKHLRSVSTIEHMIKGWAM